MKLSVIVKLRSREEKVTQVGDAQFIVAVREIPEKGKANERVIRLLSGFLQVPKSHIHIIRGATSRTKIVEID